ncbi:TetR/AcrR family transcriptional regulator [Rhodovarius crocodyli]|nr:TetR/AcrR family transcriptional regulator [Rhodovarius crocodyli]
MPGTADLTAEIAPRRPRVPAAERERMILDAAVTFFAEQGPEGQTRLLARAIGIPHSVLYRHFPSKEDLFAAVCEEMFRRRWQPEWEALPRAPGVSLEERLLRFYRQAGQVILAPEFLRLALFVGLADHPSGAVLRALMRQHVVAPLAAALGTGPAAEEAAWNLHGRVFYAGMRMAVWRGGAPRDPAQAVEAAIRGHVAGALAALPA